MAARPSRRPSKRPVRPVARLRPWQSRYARLPVWVRRTCLGVAAIVALGVVALVVGWVVVGRTIDARLTGEARPAPRVFGRPFELRPGSGVSSAQLVQRLNEIGYAEVGQAAKAGEFSVARLAVSIAPRDPRETGALVRAEFARPNATVVSRVVADGKPVRLVRFEAPLLATLAPGERRRHVPLASLPPHVINAVLAIEDRRFYDHPGVDPIGAVRALWTNLRGDSPYLVGGSTVTQQIVKNTFLTPEKTLRRKLQEQFMAIVLESRFTKDQILEIYLNDVVLGQRGPFAIHGVAEAARIFFGKDVRNVTLAEAATMAGVIQSPSRLSPFRNPERARDRRNVVLREMAAQGLAEEDEVRRATEEPIVVAARSLENEAPYFVDYASDLIEETYAGILAPDAAVEMYTTLDLRLQRLAQEAVGEGLAQVDKQLAARKRRGVAQAALVALDPRTGDILALVGGRAYSQSQYNRATLTRRQPGSIFKPFVYLAAFETAASDGRKDLTPATVVIDEPTIFKDGENDYAPANYESEYDGPVTLRRALALSRNVVAIKVAEMVGYDRVAALWRRIGIGTPPKAVPSIALGVFEASPLEIAEAYTLFVNKGAVRPTRAIERIVENGRTRDLPPPDPRPVARADTTYLVTNMMRSVLNEGTGAGVRARGFSLDAAGKTGTTNDLRDAWFVGFTPELLAVVWVGFDDNQPIGLSGSQAALPIWTSFMRRAAAGRPNREFEAPAAITFANVDRDTGELADPSCPRVITEAFLPGTEPSDVCHVHGTRIPPPLSGIGSFFRRIF